MDPDWELRSFWEASAPCSELWGQQSLFRSSSHGGNRHGTSRSPSAVVVSRIRSYAPANEEDSPVFGVHGTRRPRTTPPGHRMVEAITGASLRQPMDPQAWSEVSYRRQPHSTQE